MVVGKIFIKILVWILLALISCVLVIGAVTYFYVSPRIDQWRPEIQNYLKEQTGVALVFDNIKLRWHGLSPVVQLANVSIVPDASSSFSTAVRVRTDIAADNTSNLIQKFDAANMIQQVEIGVDYSALWTKWTKATVIRLQKADLTLTNTGDGQWLLGNYILSGPSFKSNDKQENINWLHKLSRSNVPHMEFKDVRLKYEDLTRAVEPLEIIVDKASIKQNKSYIDASIKIRVPQIEKNELLLKARLHKRYEQSQEQSVILTGESELEWKDLTIPAVQQWFDLSPRMQHIGLGQGKLSLDFKVSESVNKLIPWVSFKTSIHNLHVEDKETFRHSFDLQQVLVHGRYSLNASGLPQVDLQRLFAQDTNVKLDVAGNWQQDPNSDNGVVDLKGQIYHLNLNYLSRFLPTTINKDTLDWLDQAFVGGALTKGKFQVQGIVDHFPFGVHSDSGHSNISAEFNNLVLKFDQEQTPVVWPAVYASYGRVAFVEDQITIKSPSIRLSHLPKSSVEQNASSIGNQQKNQQSAKAVKLSTLGQGVGNNKVVVPSSSQSTNADVSLQEVTVRLLSMEDGAKLDIQATGHDRVEQFLMFVQNSPLREILHNSLNFATGSGLITVPIQLSIPIDDVDSTQVLGTLKLHDNTFILRSNIPALTKINGELSFNEHWLKFERFQAVSLGGELQASGYIGKTNESLDLHGTVTAKALQKYVGRVGMRRLSGQTKLQAKLTFPGNGEVNAKISSDLKGMAFDFPGIMYKSAQTAQPLQVQWLSADKAMAKGVNQLRVQIPSLKVALIFDHNSTRKGPFFQRFAMAFNTQPQLLSQGFHIHGVGGALDLKLWRDIVSEFQTSSQKQSTQQPKHERVLPDYGKIDLRLKALTYGDVSFNNIQMLLQSRSDNIWKGSVDSQKIRGDIEFERNPQNGTAKYLKGRFDYIHWQGLDDHGTNSTARLATSSKSSDSSVKSEQDSGIETKKDKSKNSHNALSTSRHASINKAIWDINRLDIEVKQTNMFGKNFGHVTLRGAQVSPAHWKLNQLAIANNVGSFYSTGKLVSQNQQIYADISFNLNALSLEKFLDNFSITGVFKDGQGFIQGKVRLDDAYNPKLNNMNLSLQGQLKNGSIIKLDSSAVSLLELLSLQSVSKITNFGRNLSNAFRSGLSYSMIRFSFDLKNQQVTMPDFRLDNDVIAIVAAGNINLKNMVLNFDIVAVPHVEMSGAAILSGVLVNPVVGVGAFLSQWLLQEPLQRNLTSRFKVHGTWNLPLVEGVSLKK